MPDNPETYAKAATHGRDYEASHVAPALSDVFALSKGPPPRDIDFLIDRKYSVDRDGAVMASVSVVVPGRDPAQETAAIMSDPQAEFFGDGVSAEVMVPSDGGAAVGRITPKSDPSATAHAVALAAESGARGHAARFVALAGILRGDGFAEAADGVERVGGAVVASFVKCPTGYADYERVERVDLMLGGGRSKVGMETSSETKMFDGSVRVDTDAACADLAAAKSWFTEDRKAALCEAHGEGAEYGESVRRLAGVAASVSVATEDAGVRLNHLESKCHTLTGLVEAVHRDLSEIYESMRQAVGTRDWDRCEADMARVDEVYRSVGTMTGAINGGRGGP